MTPSPDRPAAHPAHGLGLAALALWTLSTGLVDAFSFLHLHNVFVANMTGNLVFLGFYIGGNAVVPIPIMACAVLGFVLGAFFSSIFVMPRFKNSRLITATVGFQIATTIIALAITAFAPGWLAPTALALGVALGMQNAAARSLKVPDVTTTVLTLTVTGLAMDRTGWATRNRRLLMVALMVGGAALGAMLLKFVSPLATLTALLIVQAATGALAAAHK